jgi:hypothetical protein
MTTITISSPANARTDADGLRYYTWQGQQYPSVTTVQRMAGIPHRLHTWALSQVVARAVNEVDTLNAMLTRERKPRERVLEANRVSEASRWLRVAATEERDRAAAVGSAVHDAVATGQAPGDIPDVLDTLKDGRPVTVDGAAVRNRLVQFRGWLDATGAEVLAQEFQVFNLTVGYGGSGDLIVGFPSGRVALIDLKTGSSVFSEHAIQLRAYREAEFAGRDDVVDEVVTALLRSVTDLGILHLAEDHWEYLALRDDPGAGAAFAGLRTFAMWMAANPEIDMSVTARRTNRVCPVCSLLLETQDVKERPMLVDGRMTHVNTHRACTPGEVEAAA